MTTDWKYDPELRIFPNSRILESSTKADRTKYIIDDLKHRGLPRGSPGKYWLRSLRMTRRISIGTIALFRFGIDEILGEGVISSESTEYYYKDENGEEYEGYIMFDPTTLMAYPQPIPITRVNDIIRPLEKTMGQANAWTRLPMTYHQKILDLLQVRENKRGL